MEIFKGLEQEDIFDLVSDLARFGTSEHSQRAHGEFGQQPYPPARGEPQKKCAHLRHDVIEGRLFLFAEK